MTESRFVTGTPEALRMATFFAFMTTSLLNHASHATFIFRYPQRVEDRNSLALRLHYLARAKPMEDERTIKAQHVAPGTWCGCPGRGTGKADESGQWRCQ